MGNDNPDSILHIWIGKNKDQRTHLHQIGHDVSARHDEQDRHQDGHGREQIILRHVVSVGDTATITEQ